jgi:hypothetical protein
MRGRLSVNSAEWSEGSATSVAANGLAAQLNGVIKYPGERCGSTVSELWFVAGVIAFLMANR